MLLLSLALGCAYPRRSTPLTPAIRSAQVHDAPEGLWRLLVLSAEIPREKRSGLPWDGDKDPPDPYVRLLANGQEIWHTRTLQNQLRPAFNESPPSNLAIPRNARLRIELWDDDGMSRDPIGVYEGRALGEAIMESETIVKLEGGATLSVRVERPEPHRGVGIARYEVRKDALLVLEVLPRSPAARAGLKPGDRITAIAGRTVAELGPKRAESALVLTVQNQSELTVASGGKPRTLKLDRGHVWLSL